MKLHRYPLLCWQMGSLSVGHVIGTPHVFAHPRMERLREQAIAQLQADLRVYHETLHTPITAPQLVHLAVTVRPIYQVGDKRYPVDPMTLPVAAVVGTGEAGEWECHLPLFGKKFCYYAKEQRDELIRHFVRDTLDERPPENLARYLMPQRPWLDEVVVRVVVDKPRQRSDAPSVRTEALRQVADRVPGLGSTADPVWERDALIAQVADTLSREGTSLVLVGEPGSGKSAILGGAVRRLHHQTRDAARGPTVAWRSTCRRLMGDARYLGEWQAQCEELLQELRLSGHLLWITDLLELVQVGGSGPQSSMAAFFLPALVRGDVQLIGELTAAQLAAAQRLLPAFVAQLHVVTVPPLTLEQTRRVVAKYAEDCARHRAIEIDRDAQQSALQLSRRFQRQQALPGAVLGLLHRCVAEQRQEQGRAVTRERVLALFGRESGMAPSLLRDEMTLDPAQLHDEFAAQLIGQPTAVAALTRVVTLFKAGLNPTDRPIATLLFAGPTGVGKTQAAKCLGQYFYGQGQASDPLIRVDMSECQHPAQIARLLGSGRQPGTLVRDMRERPYAVVLLDEIEKAHPAFFDLLMTLLDEGTLTDDLGQVTDFRNAIVIMTTNLGSEGRSVGFFADGDRDHLAAIRRFFRPEFYNRLDEVVVFAPLTSDAIHRITRLELAALAQREGLRQRGIALLYDDSLVAALAARGVDPRLGARPLQRVIESQVVVALAQWLLSHPPTPRLTLSWRDDAIVIVP